MCEQCGCSMNRPDKRRKFCDSCRLARKRVSTTAAKNRWLAKHPGKKGQYQRRAILKRKYGMTEAEVDQLLTAQGGICAMPGCVKPATRIDHCHRTGKVRGMLCHRCNVLLAGVEDANFRQRAEQYLSRVEVKTC